MVSSLWEKRGLFETGRLVCMLEGAVGARAVLQRTELLERLRRHVGSRFASLNSSQFSCDTIVINQSMVSVTVPSIDLVGEPLGAGSTASEGRNGGQQTHGRGPNGDTQRGLTQMHRCADALVRYSADPPNGHSALSTKKLTYVTSAVTKVAVLDTIVCRMSLSK